MTIVQAVIKVMRKSAHPLTLTEVYDRIVDQNLYTFRAQDPKHVVVATVRRHCINLDFPTAAPKKYFRLEQDGKFTPLSKPILKGYSKRQTSARTNISDESQPKSLDSAYKEICAMESRHRSLLKAKILSELKELRPIAFEHFSKRLLEVYGFEDLKVTSITNDGGIDGHGKLKVGLAHMQVAFQCKRWTKANIGRPEIDRFRGATQGQYQQGIFFTTASFVPAAQQASIRHGAVPIILVDGSGIIDLMIEKQFGVQKDPLSIYTYALDMILDDNTNDE